MNGQLKAPEGVPGHTVQRVGYRGPMTSERSRKEYPPSDIIEKGGKQPPNPPPAPRSENRPPGAPEPQGVHNE
jgi:hypothetical protein